MLALSHSIGATEKTRNQIREDMLAGIPLQKHFEKIPLWKIHSKNPVGKANLWAFLHSWAKSSE